MKTSHAIILVTAVLAGLLVTGGGEQQAIEQDSSQQLLLNSPRQGEMESPRLKPSALEPHAPIYIDGNLNFEKNASFEGWEGHGNETHPYIIENYNITTTADYTNGIEIRNTDVYFTIRNCFIKVMGLDTSGIYLHQVKNGALADNTASNNREGIVLWYSSNNTLSGNTVSDNTLYGISIWYSSNNTLSGNTASDNGDAGILLDSSSSNNTLSGNTASNNTNDGIYLWNSSNNTLTGNTASNNGDGGISLNLSSNNNTLTGNTMSNNQYGIVLGNTSNSTLSGNTMNNNQYGMNIFLSSNNTISSNTVIGNNNYGIYLTSSDYNEIYLNDFTDNNGGAVQGYSNTATNYFSDGVAGNYWSDYTGSDSDGDGIGETYYAIDGGAGAQDPYPLVVPVEEFRYPHAPIYINGNANFAGNATLERWSGHGTETHPYIIERYNITTGAAGTNGIEIRNTSVHFIIRNCYISATGTDTNGIYLYEVKNGTLAGNNASNNIGYGIDLVNSSYNTISDNTMNNNSIGSGIYLVNSSNNTLTGNTLNNNGNDGIELYGSSNNTFTGNNMTSNNRYGICLESSSNNNAFTGNTVINNQNYGIYLKNSDYNDIYLNDFIDNNGGNVQGYSSTATNNFSDGVAGNYWSDYTGSDSDGDGIGETSYAIDGGAGAEDPHPLMVPVEEFRYPHAPIYIDGNLDFAGNATLERWSGHGTETHPYIIERYNITTGAAGTNGIEIRNTSVHFIIRNCFIRATGTDAHGIYLYEVKNGTLAGNTASNNTYRGIYLESSSNNTLSGNTASNNSWIGIQLYYSSNNTLSGNNASNNRIGILLSSYSSNNTLSGNNASNNNYWYGIYLESSSNNNTLSENTASNNYNGIYLYSYSSNNTLSGNNASNNIGYGISLSGSNNNNILSGNNASNNGDDGIHLSGSNNTLTGNTASDNVDYGIRLGGSNNTLSGNIARDNGDVGICLGSSFNNTLTGNSASNNGDDGIELSGSNNTLTGNSASDNDWYGILLRGSNNTLTGNTVWNNRYGIGLSSSSNNTLTGNIVTNNNWYGIYLTVSDYNDIYLNDFIDNNGGAVQAFSNTNTNVFTNGSHGNFWSDYTGSDTTGDGIGETPYSIDGGAGAEDPHPLIVASMIVLSWPDQLLALNGAVTSISDWTWQPLQTNALTMELWLNDVSQGKQPESFSWSITLKEGSNNITAVAFFDATGTVTLKKTFLVTLDTIPPVISLIAPEEGGVYQSGTEITVNVIGHAGSLYYYWDTGPHVAATGLTFQLPAPDGTHVLHLEATDAADNTRLTSFSFVTDDTPPAAAITGLTDQQTVSKTLIVEVNPSDANSIARVEFELVGLVVHPDTASPYTWIWDTTTFTDGSYVIKIHVYDVAGNVFTSGPYTVLVDNAATTTPTSPTTSTTTTTTTGTTGSTTMFSSGITGMGIITAIAAGGAGRLVYRRVKKRKVNE